MTRNGSPGRVGCAVKDRAVELRGEWSGGPRCREGFTGVTRMGGRLLRSGSGLFWRRRGLLC